MVVGGLAGYFLDPGLGRRRRHLVRDRTAGLLRRGRRHASRTLRTTAVRGVGRCRGLVHTLLPAKPGALDDVGLAHKVESILFRDETVPKGSLSINAERGTVFLRGEVETPELAAALEGRVRRIAGVEEVENLLHAPGTAAPHSRTG
jgi:hypothetical protein